MDNAEPVPYIGRFAPSPTGPLHLGSLLSAIASYLDAKAKNGQWLLRIEDIDPPREEPGSSDRIIASLATHGLHWDGDILYQSKQTDYYQDCLTALTHKKLLFHCDCSRAQMQDPIYSGRCRNRTSVSTPYSTRLKAADNTISFTDAVQGEYRQQLLHDVGDFVLWRKDGLPAYQLAVVADDDYQGVTHIIRGSDLLDSTPRQIYLYQQLDFAIPRYGHLPLLVNKEGQKLSKQNHAAAIDDSIPLNNLWQVLSLLKQTLPDEQPDTVESLLQWAIQHWDITAVSTDLNTHPL